MIKEWIEQYRTNVKFSINNCSIGEMDSWSYFDGMLGRKDMAYFSIKAVTSENPLQPYNELPIIDQPEIGILGFIVCEKEGKCKILLHAKSEPGNMFLTQIGPSVQATASNYRAVHGGKKQPYIDFFLNHDGVEVIAEVKQSEQGNRFLNKYNLNVIVKVSEEQIVINESKYIWADLLGIIENLNEEYLFNTDFKSVITQLLEWYLKKRRDIIDNPIVRSYFNNINEQEVNILIEKISAKRKIHFYEVGKIDLNTLKRWSVNDSGIIPENKSEFGFSFYNVWLEDREITHWSQPLIFKRSVEYLDLYACKIKEEFYFVFKERFEIGFVNSFQLGPTFQKDDFRNNDIQVTNVLCSFKQSEEGGRFYQNISEYRIVEIDTLEKYVGNENYVILNVYQICALLKIQGVFTNEARSLISGMFSLIK